ncbi:hypothetical protein EVAR_30570_1 [Eumeta japonica]|uniref:Uncharacterized protein n=1 Tax=Eumeta variegata TaxID=151549 RepID=A0A4C1VPB9_EUMVA|nr:hypothetical protein EVAR_30570_1 [Eumeta japonica]
MGLGMGCQEVGEGARDASPFTPPAVYPITRQVTLPSLFTDFTRDQSSSYLPSKRVKLTRRPSISRHPPPAPAPAARRPPERPSAAGAARP